MGDSVLFFFECVAEEATREPRQRSASGCQYNNTNMSSKLQDSRADLAFEANKISAVAATSGGNAIARY